MTADGPRSPQMETLCRLFAETIGTQRVGVDENFFAAGGDSLGIVKLVGRIRTTFGVRIGPDVVFRDPTALAVARHLDLDSQGENTLDRLLALRPHGSRAPLFCVPPGGGMGWCYAALLSGLDADRPVLALQARGLRPGDTPVPGGIAETVEDYLGLIRAAQPEGPYHLLGWSYGGTVAHALACRLQDAGATVGLLAVMDAEPTAATGPATTPSARELMLSLLQEFGYDLRDLADVPLRPDRVVALLRRENSAMAYLEPASVDAVVKIYANNQRSMVGYEPDVFDGDLDFFSATQESAVDPHRWTPYVRGQVRLHPVHSTHRNISRPEHMAEIAQVLNALTAGA